MSKQKLFHSFLSVVSLSVLTTLTLLPVAPAGSVSFKPKGSPEQTAGGGSRGICSLGTAATAQTPPPGIAALIPATDGELTANSHPTVFVRIPESQSLKAEFSLSDENANGIYQTTMPVPSKAGIVGFQLPNNLAPLETGKRYKWSVAVICDPANRQRDVVVEGWLQRGEITPALSNQLAVAQPLQKAKIYAENGFWYDTVVTLAELKRTNPDNTQIVAEWGELLESVGLTELIQAPFVNCCQAPK